MKLALFGTAAAVALVVGAGSASAQQPVYVVPAAPQPIVVPPPASPGITIGGSIGGRGFSVGGVYSSAPAVVAAPAPVVVAAPPPAVVVAPVVRVGYPYYYGRPYYGYGRPYYAAPHHHHW